MVLNRVRDPSPTIIEEKLREFANGSMNATFEQYETETGSVVSLVQHQQNDYEIKFVNKDGDYYLNIEHKDEDGKEVYQNVKVLEIEPFSETGGFDKIHINNVEWILEEKEYPEE